MRRPHRRAARERGPYVAFSHWWADLLRVFTGPGVAGICGKECRRHMIDAIRSNKPYDDVVRELLTADGDVWDNPAIGYYMRDRAMPLDNTAITTRICRIRSAASARLTG